MPLQSLSLPSQISGVGPTAPTQVIMPAVHAVRPCLHSPTLLPQTWPTCGKLPLSTVPSQLLSMPSHVSGLGAFGFEQTQPPAPEHTREPWLHGGVSAPMSLQVAPGGGHQCKV